MRHRAVTCPRSNENRKTNLMTAQSPTSTVGHTLGAAPQVPGGRESAALPQRCCDRNPDKLLGKEDCSCAVQLGVQPLCLVSPGLGTWCLSLQVDFRLASLKPHVHSAHLDFDKDSRSNLLFEIACSVTHRS